VFNELPLTRPLDLCLGIRFENGYSSFDKSSPIIRGAPFRMDRRFSAGIGRIASLPERCATKANPVKTGDAKPRD
jgi:hypothetical protein